MLALFRRQDRLTHALACLRDAGIGPLETYTPAPLPDAADAPSPIPFIILLAALLGALASLGLQTYSFVVAYPFKIGGRPQFAWPSFVPTIFENAILVAVAAGFVAFLAINRLPRLYAPIDEAAVMREVSRNGWVVAVRSDDARLLERARGVLQPLGPERIEEVEA